MSLPTDLRVLCRRLTSIPPNQLPHSVPTLISHILRCKDALSAPQDHKAKDSSSETPHLVNKLRTIISTLLNGKSAPARFAAISLVKAFIDVGGWECLRESGPWVRGLLSILQKNDPLQVKELSVVTLTKIYTLVHEYQTLTREIATPTIPAFFTACLQLIKPPASGQRLRTPSSVVETILDSFSTLISLYPTTCRTFNSQIRTAIRPYIASTSSDESLVPQTLQQASRHLLISIPFTAAGKTGPSDEWAKLVLDLVTDFHSTADHVFRAVQENWEPPSSYTRSKVNFDLAPQAGGPSPEQFPAWTGIRAGTERLVALLHIMADSIRYPTKVAVTIPVGKFLDLVSRVILISRTSPKSQSWEQALETHPAVGREEKEDLWSAVPDLHVAALHLLVLLIQRLQRNTLPLVPEIIEDVTRVFKSGIDNSDVRVASYDLLNELLPFCGSTMPKEGVDTLGLILLSCCRDLQQEAGHLTDVKRTSSTPTDAKKNGTTANADLFLQPQTGVSTNTVPSPVLGADHLAAAETLLASILAYLPQQHLKAGLRGLIDQTAILSRNKTAMVASVLHPYMTQGGRMYPSILPYLSQQFPDDQGVEILRSNMRTSAQHLGDLPSIVASFEEVDDQQDEEMASGSDSSPEQNRDIKIGAINSRTAALGLESGSSAENPFQARKADENAEAEASNGFAILSPQKRKPEDALDPKAPKRQDVEKKVERPVIADTVQVHGQTDEDDNDSDDESVHLNMELDDEDDEDGEDEGEDENEDEE